MKGSERSDGSQVSLGGQAATEAPRRVVSEFIKHVESGEFERIVELLSSSIVNAVGGDALGRIFKRNTDEIWQRGGVDRIDVLEESCEEAAASLRVRILYGDGSSDKESICLVREEATWKIDMMS